MALDTAANDAVLRRVSQRIAAEPARTLAELLFAEATDALTTFEPHCLAREAAAAADFLSERARGRPAIRLRRSRLARTDGREDDVTILEIANDDMPFLVASVVAELQAGGLAARLLLHPILKVQRDGNGRLERIVGAGDRNWSDGSQESLIVILLDPLSEARAEGLTTDLMRVLTDVRVAVTDWQSMQARLDRAIATLESAPPPGAPGLLAETLSFCRWLRDGHFTFLGMREHELVGDIATGELKPVQGSALGVLRDANVRTLSRNRTPLGLNAEVRRHLSAPDLLVVSKSNLLSRVHRRVHMDYVGLKTFHKDGTLAGELRIVGLFTSAAYTQPTRLIPLIRHKVEAVAAATGYPPESHAGKGIENILETFPRDELFQIPADELTRWAATIMDLEIRPRVRVLARQDQFGRYASVLVYVPRDRFSTAVREKVGEVLAEIYGGRVSAFTPWFTGGPLVRVHFIIGRNEGAADAPASDLAEARVRAVVRSWGDDLADNLMADPAKGTRLRDAYAKAFPPAYMETFSPARAVVDIGRIEALAADGPVGIDFYRDASLQQHQVRAAIYRFGGPLPLSERVPVLEAFGFSVIDERSYEISPAGEGARRTASLHDMLLATANGLPFDLDRHDVRLEAAFRAVVQGAAESDGFNRLVISAGADWREASVLRALAAYMRQLRLPFGSRYISEVLVTHAGVARDLIELFRARFDPSPTFAGDERGRHIAVITQRIEGALAAIPSLDEDRILRSLLGLVTACVRTNFFQESADAARPEALAFKLDPAGVDAMPEPKPFREIFVYGPRVEGVHLRFDRIARGGIRWSDRAQDFRTEVLGLCKAQQVKNTVIVPSGAKGGFVPKWLPKTGTREEIQAEGTAAYRLFISSLLTITDNIVDGRVVPPAGVVRHEPDDPYLVVAADKGTATFSDVANAISAEHNFWLGDAFASGGSAGYDHKAMGITARGAWECVKRHFREMDVDIQTTPFRVAGVGDMSGDVFGNGMLLSPHIRLVAAFDHRDIFVDPEPDAAASFAERTRLFRLPRSSWRDYDARLISAGGGVFSRQAKSIVVSPEMAAVLGLPVGSVPPTELLKAILRMDVDLLWFGGIGTYVRAATETDDQAGDRANDAIRITAGELRAKVVGEGANLGLTQRGRVEASARGVRLNTDFIDNSAGVNSSDIEVNIKIALGPAVRSGRLAVEDRNVLLASMTDDVAAACLINNIQQSLAISLTERRGVAEIGRAQRLMQALEARGLLDRKLEALPTDAELASRQVRKAGLTRPEIAVLLAWSKIAVAHDVLASDLPDLPGCAPLLMTYFPEALRERYSADLESHRLRREIITTRIVNSVVNRGGPAFVQQLVDETGRSVADIAAAYLAVRDIFDLPRLWSEIDSLDGRIRGALQLELYGCTQDLLLTETAELLRSPGRHAIGEAAGRYRPVAAELEKLLQSVLAPGQRQTWQETTGRLTAGGVPVDLARRLSAVSFIGVAPHAADLMARTGADLATAAAAIFGAEAYLRLDTLRIRAARLMPADYYDGLAIQGALGTIETAGRAMATAAVADGAPLPAWLGRHGSRFARTKATLDAIAEAGELTVSRLVVAASQVRDIAT